MVNSEFRPTQEGLACIFGRSRELLGMSLLVAPCMLQGNLHVKFGITFIYMYTHEVHQQSCKEVYS